MSIESQISKIIANRNTIRNKMVEFGVAVHTDNLDSLATKISEIKNNGAVSVELVEGNSYTIPMGWHNGGGIVKAVTDIPGEADQYKTQSKSVTPTKRQQTVTADEGYYALDSVTVAAIPDAYQDVTKVTAEADKVLEGFQFVDADGHVVDGTMPHIGDEIAVLDVAKTYHDISEGRHDGAGRVSIVLEEKSVTPTKSAQTITPTDGKVLSEVSVAAIPDAYQDVTGVTAEAAHVLDGKFYVTPQGVKTEGTMANNGDVSASMDGLTKTSVTIPAGYTDGGTISLTNDIETALAAI